MPALADVPARFPRKRTALIHGGARWTVAEFDAWSVRGFPGHYLARPEPRRTSTWRSDLVRDDAGKFRQLRKTA